jgi:hypothetical protein
VNVRFLGAGACFAVASCCSSRLALAEPAEEPLRLEYHATGHCDDEQQFLAALRSRAPRARLARADEPARTFVVEIEQDAKSTRARLTIRESNGQRTTRDVETRDCREAVDALALIAALAVDPQGMAERGADTHRASEPQKTPTVRSKDAKPQVPPPSADTTDTSPAVEDVSATAGSPWIWAGSIAGSGRGGVAPGILFGGRFGITLERFGDGWWSPSIRLSGEYATRNGFALEGGVATFAYSAGGLEVCLLRVPRTGRLVVRPCLATDLGVIHASGSDVLNARSANRVWWAVGGVARVEWSLTARIGLELEIGCTFPVWRDRFRFEPLLIYEVPRASGIAALGLAMHFP